MPFEDCVEMICDQFAAGKAYMKDEWSLEYQCGWWQKRMKVHKLCMHPATFEFANRIYEEANECKNDANFFFEEIFNRKYLKNLYLYTYYKNME